MSSYNIAMLALPEPTQGVRSDGVSLYVRLAASLRARIIQGEWDTGERIPAFEDLATTYGVAVNTVRKAIELLCIEGLLQSSRGRGTTVASKTSPTIDEPLRMAMYDPMTESDEVAIDILKTEAATLPQILVQNYLPAEAYTRILKTHSMRGTTYGLLDIFVEQKAFARFPKRAIDKSKVLRLLRDYGRADVRLTRQQVTITHADDAIVSALKCPPASPLVRVRRWKLDAKHKIILACDILYRGDLFIWDVTEPEQNARPIVPDVRHEKEPLRDLVLPNRSPRPTPRR